LSLYQATTVDFSLRRQHLSLNLTVLSVVIMSIY